MWPFLHVTTQKEQVYIISQWLPVKSNENKNITSTCCSTQDSCLETHFPWGAEEKGGPGAHYRPCMEVCKEGIGEDEEQEERWGEAGFGSLVLVQTRPATCVSIPEDQLSRRNTLRRERREMTFQNNMNWNSKFNSWANMDKKWWRAQKLMGIWTSTIPNSISWWRSCDVIESYLINPEVSDFFCKQPLCETFSVIWFGLFGQ